MTLIQPNIEEIIVPIFELLSPKQVIIFNYVYSCVKSMSDTCVTNKKLVADTEDTLISIRYAERCLKTLSKSSGTTNILSIIFLNIAASKLGSIVQIFDIPNDALVSTAIIATMRSIVASHLPNYEVIQVLNDPYIALIPKLA